MGNILRWIWQFPQNLIGYLWSRPYKFVMDYTMKDGNVIKVYFTSNIMGCGVSLGQYIILDFDNYFNRSYCYNAVCHEYGHTLESELLGPLYLLRVGIVSALRNLWDRKFHKRWSNIDRVDWYYKNGTFNLVERAADLMGQAER